MKVSVSIPDPLVSKAEALAERLGLSRSELYARALEAFAAKASIQAVDSEPSEADEAMIAEAIRQVRAKRNSA